MPVRFTAIQDAFLYITGAAGNEAILDRDTGEIFYRSDFMGHVDEGFPEEEAREDARHVALPDRRDLDLGSHLVRRFAEECLSQEEADEVRRIFDRKGAYRKFKDYLIRHGKIDRWHAFENEAEERALRAWCAENEIELAD